MAWKKSGRDKPSRDEILGESNAVKDLIGQWNVLIVKDGLLYRKWIPSWLSDECLQLVTPTEMKGEIFKQLHCERSGGHFGVQRTLQKVRQRFYWPHCKSDITRWCAECDVCAQVKSGPRYKAPLGSCQARAKLEVVAVDVLGELPETLRGNKYILVITDWYTKWTHAIAMPDQTAQTVADSMINEFIQYFGAPVRIHSDQGRNFESQLFQQVCQLLGIERSRTSPYHPADNGQVERYNRTLQQMLKCFINEHRDDWDDHLPLLNMAYRATPHESTGCSPNLMMFGHENAMALDVMVGSPPSGRSAILCHEAYVEWLRNSLTEVHMFADEKLHVSAKRRKRYYDLKSKPYQYRPGQYCWRWYPPAAKGKLSKGWTGPVRVMSCPTDVNCVVRLQPEGEVERRVHVDCLKPYVGGIPPSWLDWEDSFSENSGDVTVDAVEDNSENQEVMLGSVSEEDEVSSEEEEFLETVDDFSTPQLGRGHRQRKPLVRYSPNL